MRVEKAALLALLCLVGAIFGVLFVRALRTNARASGVASVAPRPLHLVVGLVTDFLDTLGIGSFATTTTAFRLGRLVDDRVVPGTLNVGHALPTIVQALIYITIVRVEMTTLVVMIGAAVGGSMLGSSVVSLWPRRVVRFSVGGALVVASVVMLENARGALPAGGDALSLEGERLAVGALVNFALGALMTAGVGLYGPCMILVSLLGMSPTAAFPIMMGSCAFLMPAASVQFVRRGAFDARAAVGLAIGGIPGVLVAAFIVESLPLAAARWLVLVAASYAAITLLVAAIRNAE
ncbi:MAG TPA: sulfite exporter TauE/SafE family protein [Polyangiaceae bacterium]|nr:sulfite exporter TauE/SafE family protein [Polyangiaceae bacterium]